MCNELGRAIRTRLAVVTLDLFPDWILGGPGTGVWVPSMMKCPLDFGSTVLIGNFQDGGFIYFPGLN